ncbi:MAG TPA: hypothetical protein VJA21_11120 [Verrucomicrobiae bacterium]
MPKQTRGLVVACLLLGVIAVSLYFGAGGRSQKIDLGPYNALGAVTAEETARLIGNKGQVLLLVPDTGPDKNPSVEAEVQTFQQALKKQRGLTLVVDRVPVTPMLMMATGGGVPPEQLFRSLEAHPNSGALVLLFRFPQLADDQIELLKKKDLKIVVVSSFYPDYQRLLDSQTIHLAIAPRQDAPEPGGPAPRTLRERFDQDYTIFRAAGAIRSP